MTVFIRRVGIAGAALVVLAGCSGSPDTDATTAPGPTANATTPTVASEASTPQPSVGNTDDPLCAAAQENLTQAADLESKTTDLTALLQDPTFLTSGDASELNQWGQDMLVMTASTKTFYELGVTETAGEDINADFVTLGAFVEKYSDALANAAADADSPKGFLEDVQQLFGSADVMEAAQAAPAAASNVASYLGTRCEITS